MAWLGVEVSKTDRIIFKGDTFTSFYDNRYIQPDTRIIQVDIDNRDIGRIYPVELGIQADAGETLSALLKATATENQAVASSDWQTTAQAPLRQDLHLREPGANRTPDDAA